MDYTHIHLLLNHFPIIGTLIGLGVMLYGMVRHHTHIRAVGAVIVLSMTIMAVPVYLTGEPAEEQVEHLPGISQSMLEEHEEGAELAMWLMAAAGLACLGALLLQYRSNEKAPFNLAFALTLLAFLAMARVGYLGAHIRHSELRTGQQAGQQAERQQPEAP